jgi:hypothetical protein
MRVVLFFAFLLLFAGFVPACGGEGNGEPGDGAEADVPGDGTDADVTADEVADIDMGDVDMTDGDAADTPVEGCEADADCADEDPCTVNRCNTTSGECFIESTIVTCVDDDTCCPTACDGSTDNDCPPVTLPRLVVSDPDAGVLLWDNADEITSDAAADATLGDLSGHALALALYGERLVVASSDGTYAFFIYDDIARIGDGASYDDRIGVDAVGGSALSQVGEMSADGEGNLWTVIYQGSIWLVREGASLGSASPGQVEFMHPWSQINSMELDVAGNKLLGGQISGAGLIVWNDPTSDTGTGNENDWTLHVASATSMLIDSDRLYVGCWNEPYLQIWNGISSITATAAPDATMAAGSNLDEVWDVFVRDNVLVACVFTTGVSKVNVYLDAGALDGETAPDFEIDDALLDWPRKAYLDANENLYVMDSDGILIFSNALSAPALVTEITAAADPSDFLVIE